MRIPLDMGRSTTQAEPAHHICLYDTSTGELAAAVGGGQFNFWPRLDGDWLVWRVSNQAPRIRASNLATGEEFELPPAGLPFPDHPNISGHLVVYETVDELPPFGFWGDKIVTFDLLSQQIMTVATSVDLYLDYPDIYGDKVVWMQTRHTYPDPPDYDIMGYNLTSQTPFTISALPGSELWPRVDGDLVVWQWQGDIYGYDLTSGERLTITQAAGTQDWPAISGDLVVWMDNRHGRWDIYGKNLATGEEQRITWAAAYDAWQPSVWENLVAWDHELEGAAAARRMTNFTFLPAVEKPAGN